MNELAVHEEEQEPVISQSVLQLLKNRREQIGENYPKGDATLFSPLSPIFYQVTKKMDGIQNLYFCCVLTFQTE